MRLVPRLRSPAHGRNADMKERRPKPMRQSPLPSKVWQLGDVAGYAPRLILGKHVGHGASLVFRVKTYAAIGRWPRTPATEILAKLRRSNRHCF